MYFNVFEYLFPFIINLTIICGIFVVIVLGVYVLYKPHSISIIAAHFLIQSLLLLNLYMVSITLHPLPRRSGGTQHGTVTHLLDFKI